MKTLERERGVVLIISLILLAAVTVLGVSTLTGTRMNELIASNTQQKSIVFEAAESAIAYGWSIDNMMASIDSSAQGDYNHPAAVAPVGAEAALSTMLDQGITGSDALTVDVSATVTVQYCGESGSPQRTGLSADETDLRLAALRFDVLGSATITGSMAAAANVQRGVMIRPSTGRTGNCSNP